MPPNARLSWYIRLTLTRYSQYLRFATFPPPADSVPVCEAEGGLVLSLSPPILCFSGGTLVFCNITPENSEGVRATECKALVAHKAHVNLLFTCFAR